MKNWNLRRQHGEVYVLTFDSGLEVPCRALTYGEFSYYSDLLDQKVVPSVVIEDEIFCKVVKLPWLVDQLDYLKAGAVTLVAQTILQASGPGIPEEFNSKLDQARATIQSPIHQLVLIIIRAFPSYKPEDIYAMTYDQMMMRLAQAEYLLMKHKIIEEPISLFTPDETPKPAKKKIPSDLLKAWEKQSGNTGAEISAQHANSKAQDRKKFKGGDDPVIPPISREALLAKRDKIDFFADNQDLMMAGAMTGHELMDANIRDAQVMKNMEKIYPHLFNKQG